MTGEQEQRVKVLFGEALGMQGEERAAFVRSSATDAAVREEVLKMLEEHERLEDFIQVNPLLAGRLGDALERTFADGQLVAGRYRIERFLRSGGMGEVYEGYDTRLEQRIALKTILPEMAGRSRSLRRFQREIALARRVTHPNVCRVFDVAEHQDASLGRNVTFLTMEFLPGETLAERLKRTGPFSEEEARRLFRQLCQALAAAHDAGVIHRDFKPGNVILVPGGDGEFRAVITDFGLAHTVGEEAGSDPTVTGPSTVMGTPAYMAPEQFAGGQATARTDLYSLGLVIYEALTGKRPFRERSSGGSLLGRIQTPPPSICSLVPGLNPRWDEIVSRCLRPQPEERFGGAREVEAALDGGEIAAAARRDRPGRSASWNRRRWLLASVFALVTLAILLLRLPDWRRHRPAAGQARNVAVLPFQVDSADLRPLADGLMEAITSQLSQYEGMNDTLLVVPASEVQRQGVKTAADAKAKFSVNHAVEGVLQGRASRLRLLLTVVDTERMRQSRTAIVEGDRDRTLNLQDTAVTKLSNMLNLRVRPEQASDLNRISPLEPGAYDFFLQGRGYLQRSGQLPDINSAIGLFERALALDKGFSAAHAGLAEGYWLKYGRTMDSRWANGALTHGRRALELEPESALAHLTMGIVLSGTGKYREAIAEFERALAIDSRMAEAYRGLGGAYLHTGEYEKAEATYRKAIEIRPGDWQGYKELGTFYYRRSDYHRAIEQYRKVVSLNPDNATAYNNLGGFYGMLGQRDEAREMLEKALNLDPTYVAALTNYTKLLSDQGRYDEAIQRWRAAAKANPSSYRLWGNLGAAYRKVGNAEGAYKSHKEAVRLLDEAIAVNPNSGELYSFRAHYLVALDRRREALSDLSRTKSLQGSDVEALISDAVSYAALGKPGDAAIYLARALDLGYPPEQARRSEYLSAVLARIEQTRTGNQKEINNEQR